MPEKCTHRLVLQDDVMLCNNFQKIVTKAVEKHPDAVWTLYSSRLKSEHMTKNTPYVRIRGNGIWGQAIIMPREHIVPCFEWVTKKFGADFPHDDTGIGFYTVEHKVPVFSTFPSTIQHLCPNNSVLGYNNKNKVSKVWQSADIEADWDSDEVQDSPVFYNGKAGIE